jgi:hypothetical protein
VQGAHLDWVVAGVPRNLPQEAVGLPLQQSTCRGQAAAVQNSTVLFVSRCTQGVWQRQLGFWH